MIASKIVSSLLSCVAIYAAHSGLDKYIKLRRKSEKNEYRIKMGHLDNETVQLNWTIEERLKEMEAEKMKAITDQVKYANQTLIDKSSGLFGEASPIILIPSQIFESTESPEDQMPRAEKGFMSKEEGSC